MVLALPLAIVATACGPLQQAEPGGPSVPEPLPSASAPPVTPPRPAPPTGVAPRPAGGRIALLLPLAGAQAPLAEAIRDGFMAAYLADPPTSRPELRIFDEQLPTPADAYQEARAWGATDVVGPLLKESVAQVAAAATARVPTLTLNFTEAAVAAPAAFYQFSLAPEDEAQQAAARATADGRRRALALVPDSEWGRRMLTAFSAAVEQRGGVLVASYAYDPGATDFTAALQRLLLIDESRARHRQLSSDLGVPLEFEPRRRGDVDYIFLAANVASGRLIRPQLKFLYAGDIPTYATSAIYQAGSDGDTDLDGVMFADAPAVLSGEPQAENLRAALRRRWPPGALSRLRFYAMGFDAYNLWSAMHAGSLTSLPGLSGVLSTDSAGRIHRRMPWAAFRDGQIVLLPEPLAEPPVAIAPP